MRVFFKVTCACKFARFGWMKGRGSFDPETLCSFCSTTNVEADHCERFIVLALYLGEVC